MAIHEISPPELGVEVSSILPVLDAEPRATAGEERKPAARVRDLVHWSLLGIAAVFWAFHLVHLRADFPNHSPWNDWAKYTDEGWYGDAAIRHYELGHWYVKGDFNPAVALPVWPSLELVLFRLTGVSVVAARGLSVCVFGLILLTAYAVLRRWSRFDRGLDSDERPLGAAIAVCLLAVSPFCFVFVRLAILEPLLVLWGLCGLLVAPMAGESALYKGANWYGLRWAALLGAILPLAVLTKTTAVCLIPSVLYLLWASCGYTVRPFMRACLMAGGTALILWGGYVVLFVRPHYLLDYKYFFSANSYTGITFATFWPVLQETFERATFIGDVLLWAGVLSIVGWCFVAVRSRLQCNPLAVSLLLWIFGYGAFLAYHDNLSPRYYLALAVPITMLVALTFETLLIQGWTYTGATAQSSGFHMIARIAAATGAGALTVFGLTGSIQTIHFVRHPEFTFLTAAHRIRDAVNREAAANPTHPKLLLSISGSELSLITGIPSICDDFGTMELPDRVATYKPGWFATWNDVEDDKMDALSPMYKLVRVGAYPAFDDPERNLLILYRLDPISGGGHPRHERRRARTKRQPHVTVGERPSTRQLQH